MSYYRVRFLVSVHLQASQASQASQAVALRGISSQHQHFLPGFLVPVVPRLDSSPRPDSSPGPDFNLRPGDEANGMVASGMCACV